MRTKFITSFMLALVCGLPITAKVYTIQSLLGDLVVSPTGKTMIMVVISDCSFPAMGTMWNSGPS